MITNSYAWYDGAVQASTVHDSDLGSGSNPLWTTDAIPGARTAIDILDWGLWIAGGPVKAAIASTVSRLQEGASNLLEGAFNTAGYDTTRARSGGVGGPVALEAIAVGFGSALRRLGRSDQTPDVNDTPDQLHNAGLDAAESEFARGTAANVADGVRLHSQLISQQIAGGHAFEKHVLGVGNPAGAEFGGLGIRTRNQFAAHIENVINNPTASGSLRNDRSYFFDGSTNTIVIRNPGAPDGGTAFRVDTTRYPDPMVYIRDILR